jgi:glucan phosphoethanolaminetransferase (alkaline phosphatase superfamily)
MRRLGKISLLSPLVAVYALPMLAFAQSAPTSFQDLANSIVKILNAGAILLITAAVAVYFYNIVGNVFKINRGEGSGADLRKSLWLGLLIIFVMVSIWGIIQILQNSLFGGPGPSASNGVIIYGQ